MKSNWFKYVFIIFIIAILLFSIFKIKKDEKIQQEEQQQTTSSEGEKIKELKLGIAQLDTINPILSNNKNVQDISKLIYEPLVNLSSDFKAEPFLAIDLAKQSEK